MNVPLLERGTHVLKLPFHHVDQNSLQIVCEFPHSQEEFPTKFAQTYSCARGQQFWYPRCQ
jgi:hypothetical protein